MARKQFRLGIDWDAVTLLDEFRTGGKTHLSSSTAACTSCKCIAAPARSHRSKTFLILEVCVGLAFLDMLWSFSMDWNDKLKHPSKPGGVFFD